MITQSQMFQKYYLFLIFNSLFTCSKYILTQLRLDYGRRYFFCSECQWCGPYWRAAIIRGNTVNKKSLPDFIFAKQKFQKRVKKVIPRKNFPTKGFYVNPQSTHCFLKFLKKRSHFRCTGLLRSSKLVYLDGKKLACFI